MLIDTMILEPDAIKRFRRWMFTDVIAECPETGAQLKIGNGRRKAGRPRRYYISRPSTLLPAGTYSQVPLCTVTAFTDADAIDKANKRLAKEARA